MAEGWINQMNDSIIQNSQISQDAIQSCEMSIQEIQSSNASAQNTLQRSEQDLQKLTQRFEDNNNALFDHYETVRQEQELVRQNVPQCHNSCLQSLVASILKAQADLQAAHEVKDEINRKAQMNYDKLSSDLKQKDFKNVDENSQEIQRALTLMNNLRSKCDDIELKFKQAVQQSSHQRQQYQDDVTQKEANWQEDKRDFEQQLKDAVDPNESLP